MAVNPTAQAHSVQNAANADALSAVVANHKAARQDFVNFLLGKVNEADSHHEDSRPRDEKNSREDANRAVAPGIPVTFYADDYRPLQEISVDAAPRADTRRIDGRSDDSDSYAAPLAKPLDKNIAPKQAADANDTKSASPSGNIKPEKEASQGVSQVAAQEAAQAPVSVEAETEILIPSALAVDTVDAAVPTALPVQNPTILQQIQALFAQFFADMQTPENLPAGGIMARVQTFLQRLQQLLNASGAIPETADTTLDVTSGEFTLETNLPLPKGAVPTLAVAQSEAILPSTSLDPAASIATFIPPLDKSALSAFKITGKANDNAPEKLSALQEMLSAQIDETKKQLPQLQADDGSVIPEAKESLLRRIADLQSLITGGQHNDTAPMSVPKQSTPAEGLLSALAVLNQQPAVVKAANETNITTAVPVNAVRDVTSQSTNDSTSDNQSKQNPNTLNFGFGITQANTEAAKAHAPNFARMLDQTPRVPVSEQVSFTIKNMLKDGSNKITIQLDPGELGKLEIKLHVAADGKTGVVITADHKDTLDLLKRDTSGLERALTDAGLKTDTGSLSFNLRGGQQENAKDHSHAANHYLKAHPEDEELLPEDVLSKSYVVNLAEGLDIKI